jgi:hypothetical protein
MPVYAYQDEVDALFPGRRLTKKAVVHAARGILTDACAEWAQFFVNNPEYANIPIETILADTWEANGNAPMQSTALKWKSALLAYVVGSCAQRAPRPGANLFVFVQPAQALRETQGVQDGLCIAGAVFQIWGPRRTEHGVLETGNNVLYGTKVSGMTPEWAREFVGYVAHVEHVATQMVPMHVAVFEKEWWDQLDSDEE